jgi:hypothetical protein
MARTSWAAVLVAASSVAACDGAALPIAGTPAAMTPAAMTSDVTAQTQCPPDVSLPIPTRTCPTAREPGASKLMGQFPQDGSPVEVIIQVSGAAPVCDIGSCRDGSCPQFMAITDYWEAENFASQKCVRDFIDAVGGTSTPERSWLVDMVVATLTWEQIQIVATHPHVTDIEPNIGNPPP